MLDDWLRTDDEIVSLCMSDSCLGTVQPLTPHHRVGHVRPLRTMHEQAGGTHTSQEAFILRSPREILFPFSLPEVCGLGHFLSL